MYGLLDRDLHWILKAVSRYSEIEEVVIFGSRAMGSSVCGTDGKNNKMCWITLAKKLAFFVDQYGLFVI